jgi:hypothetical protein
MIKETLIHIITWIRTFIQKNFNSRNEDLPYYLTIPIAAILFIIALNGFVQLTDELAENDLVGVDEAVTNFIVSFRSDGLTALPPTWGTALLTLRLRCCLHGSFF